MRRVVVLLLALAVLAAGCGGGDGGGGGRLSKPEYESELQSLSKNLSSFGEAFTEADSPSGLSGKLEEGADLLEETADSLAELNPPLEIAEAHQALVEAARRLAGQFRQLAGRIEGASLSELTKLATELSPENNEALKALQDAVNDIASKGYTISGGE